MQRLVVLSRVSRTFVRKCTLQLDQALVEDVLRGSSKFVRFGPISDGKKKHIRHSHAVPYLTHTHTSSSSLLWLFATIVDKEIFPYRNNRNLRVCMPSSVRSRYR